MFHLTTRERLLNVSIKLDISTAFNRKKTLIQVNMKQKYIYEKHCRNNSKIKYHNPRKRQNQYPITQIHDHSLSTFLTWYRYVNKKWRG